MFIKISILIWFSLTVCDPQPQGNQTQTLLSLLKIFKYLLNFKQSCVFIYFNFGVGLLLWLTYDHKNEWSGLHNRVNSGGPLMVTCLPLGAHIKLTGGRSLKRTVVSGHNTPGYIFISYVYILSLFVIHIN